MEIRLKKVELAGEGGFNLLQDQLKAKKLECLHSSSSQVAEWQSLETISSAVGNLVLKELDLVSVKSLVAE